MTIEETFKDFSKKVNEHTKSFIVVTLNHNGSAEAMLAGNDLDLAWLAKIVDIRLTSMIETKLVKGSDHAPLRSV